LTAAAARITQQPALPLAALAAELAVDRLDALGTDDPATNLRTAFFLSYRELADDARRLFRLLGEHPEPVKAPAVAALADVPAARAQVLLRDLARAHLVTEGAGYELHPLLRGYAAELAAEDRGEPALRSRPGY
jgi:hypothetical protein